MTQQEWSFSVESRSRRRSFSGESFASPLRRRRLISTLDCAVCAQRTRASNASRPIFIPIPSAIRAPGLPPSAAPSLVRSSLRRRVL
jgi:hypothetical protein